MLYNLMLLSPASGMKTMPIFFVQIICPITVTKLILLASMLLNSLQLLHKYRDAHKSINPMLVLVSSFCKLCFLTINAVATSLGANGFGSKLIWFLAAWCFQLSVC